jgi:hypothetical protein
MEFVMGTKLVNPYKMQDFIYLAYNKCSRKHMAENVNDVYYNP